MSLRHWCAVNSEISEFPFVQQCCKLLVISSEPHLIMDSKTIPSGGRLLGEFQKDFNWKGISPTKGTGPNVCPHFILAPPLSSRCRYPMWAQTLLQCLHWERNDSWQHRTDTAATSGSSLHTFLVFVVKMVIGKHLWLHGKCRSVFSTDLKATRLLNHPLTLNRWHHHWILYIALSLNPLWLESLWYCCREEPSS